jgi:Ca2+-binding RTX toxin-like protein
VSVGLSTKNVKIDAVNGREIWTNTHLSVVSGPVTELHALGIESINLTGRTASERLYGNAGANQLNGGAGNDVLAGGAGNDTLIGGPGVDTLGGGPGNDYFVFNAPLASAGRDVITDFANASGNNDTVRLENAVMPALGGPAALNPAYFFAGAAAHDSNDRVVYNRATGALDYDSNGNAAGGVTHIALITNKPVLTASDFAVV